MTLVHARSTFPQSFMGSLGVVRPYSPEMTGGTYIYREDEAARKELFETARKERLQTLMSPFVGVGAWAWKEQPRLSTSAAVDKTAPGISALDSSSSAPLEAFFAGTGVDGQQFLSPDVIGQKTFIAKLSSVGKSWTVYQKELRLYNDSSTFQ